MTHPFVFSRLYLALPVAFVVFLFMLFSVMYSLGRWNGTTPFLFLSSDAANISAFAAGLDSPDLFEADELLGNQESFQFYRTIHIPVWRMLEKITGDYGTAALSTLPVHVFLHLLGFYILGVAIFRNRFWAFIFAILTIFKIKINLGTFWGISPDAIPRFTFQALLPFVLAAAYYYRTNYRAWPFILGVAGLLIYIHPVSAPAWGFSIWFSFWLFLPPSWSLLKRLSHMFVVGLVFLIVAAPFLANYLGNHAHGEFENINSVHEAMRYRLAPGFLDVRIALRDYLEILSTHNFPFLAAIGFLLLAAISYKRNMRDVVFVSLWAFGLIFVALFIPYIEQRVAEHFNSNPVEIDLVRNIRYLIPLMHLFCIWPLALISNRLLKSGFSLSRYAALGVTAVCGFLLLHCSFPADWAFIDNTVRSWRAGNLIPPTPERWQYQVQVFKDIKRVVPEGAPILPVGEREINPLAIRFYAKRPVVHARKDGGVFSYSSYNKLLQWRVHEEQLAEIEKISDLKLRTTKLAAFSRKLGAKYLIVNYHPPADYLLPEHLSIVYQNKFEHRKQPEYVTILKLRHNSL